MNYPVRHWGLVSPEAGAGKTTFIGANVRPNVYAIDSDNRFSFVANMIGGAVFYPSPAGRGVGPDGPYYMMTEAQLAVFDPQKNIRSIVVDSVTKIYEMHSRLATMVGSMSANQRKALGYSGNKAKEMVNKSNAVTVLSGLVTYGTDVYFTWHERESVNVQSGKFEKVVRSRISDVEMETLKTSIGMILRFERTGKEYSVHVEYARDLAGKKANTGFTVYDKPDNFWRGGAERIEHLVYTTFDDKTEAIQWAMKRLKNDDYGAVESMFDFVKNESQAKTFSDMTVSWVDHIIGFGSEKLSEQVKPVQVKANQKPEPQVPEPAVPEPVVPDPVQEPPQDDDLFPEADVQEATGTEADAQVVEATGEGDVFYPDGNLVDIKDVPFFNKYQNKFNKKPTNEQLLHASIKWHEDNGADW